jgi:hypothetical protein
MEGVSLSSSRDETRHRTFGPDSVIENPADGQIAAISAMLAAESLRLASVEFVE